MGVFARIMMGLAEQADDTTISIDATYRKAHPTASRLWLKRGGRASDRTDQRWIGYLQTGDMTPTGFEKA